MGWQKKLDFVAISARSIRGSKKVPKSCIESAEYIIQCYANGGLLDWAAGVDRDPHVYATFGDRKYNISAEENFHQKAEGTTNYKFDALPAEGSGLICLNKTSGDLGYNMHLGAVVAVNPEEGKILISNMMEAAHVAVSLATIEVIEISSPEEFIVANFGEEGLGQYALGILTI